MWDEPLTTADLLEKWREATQAAELARRLAQMAERAAGAAETAAATARKAADQAAARSVKRGDDLRTAREASTVWDGDETRAREAYHEAAGEARDRHEAEADVKK